MSLRIKNLITWIILLMTAAITIATSRYGDRRSFVNDIKRSDIQTYQVASNCPYSSAQETIVIRNHRIESPTGLTFRDFGIPTEDLNILKDQLIEEELDGQTKRCMQSQVVDQGAELVLYTCQIDGVQICQVSFEQIQ